MESSVKGSEKAHLPGGKRKGQMVREKEEEERSEAPRNRIEELSGLLGIITPESLCLSNNPLSPFASASQSRFCSLQIKQGLAKSE